MPSMDDRYDGGTIWYDRIGRAGHYSVRYYPAKGEMQRLGRIRRISSRGYVLNDTTAPVYAKRVDAGIALVQEYRNAES